MSVPVLASSKIDGKIFRLCFSGKITGTSIKVLRISLSLTIPAPAPID